VPKSFYLDDQGAAGGCAEFGLRHEPHVERNESGLKFIDYYFDRAQEIARHDTLCYANCDIIFLPDLLRAIETIQTARPRSLMAGRRWDTMSANPSILPTLRGLIAFDGLP